MGARAHADLSVFRDRWRWIWPVGLLKGVSRQESRFLKAVRATMKNLHFMPKIAESWQRELPASQGSGLV